MMHGADCYRTLLQSISQTIAISGSGVDGNLDHNNHTAAPLKIDFELMCPDVSVSKLALEDGRKFEMK